MRSLAIALLCLLASCGSIMRGGPFHVPISTTPPGATVSYDGADVGTTPCTVVMRPKVDHVEIVLAGYHKQVVEVGTSSNGWVFGNCLFGLIGIIGIVVDASDGCMRVINEEPVAVQLTPDKEPDPGVWKRPVPKPDDSKNFNKGDS